MKKLIIICGIGIASTMTATAQNTDFSLNNMYIPTAPGFVLLDKAPSLVEKPSDPKAFGVDVLNLLEGGAIQTTPYWLFKHPKYTFENHINNKTPILQTFNLSVATTKADSTSSLAIGARVTVFRIYSKKQTESIDKIKKEIIDLLVTLPIDEKAIKKKHQQLDALTGKTTFAVELAGALATSANNKKFEKLQTDRSGVWMNLRWSPHYKAPIDITAVARYTWSAFAPTASSSDSAFLDYGLALSYSNRVLDLSLEYVSRNDLANKDNYNRFALVGNYMISEKIIVVASVGKDFTEVQNILGVFGVKLALSNKKMSLN